MRTRHRKTVLRLILAHESNIKLLERMGLKESADILRISWLDLLRQVHDVSVAELDALEARVRSETLEECADASLNLNVLDLENYRIQSASPNKRVRE
jgi:hypothetical protein